jgi:hypothetical protein
MLLILGARAYQERACVEDQGSWQLKTPGLNTDKSARYQLIRECVNHARRKHWRGKEQLRRLYTKYPLISCELLFRAGMFKHSLGLGTEKE